MEFAESDIIPVIAPIGVGPDGTTFNINADTAAGAIAAAVGAARLIMLTDVPGVLDGSGELIADLVAKDARSAIDDGTITGGMIPKVQTCLDAVDAGVDAAVILDGRVPHALLLEIFTEAVSRRGSRPPHDPRRADAARRLERAAVLRDVRTQRTRAASPFRPLRAESRRCCGA